jgi:plastocyanin
MTLVVHRLLLPAAMVFVVALGKASAGEAEVRTIVVKELAFSSASIELHVGDTVEWVNQDIFVHSATADNGSFDVELAPGAHGRAALNTPGVIAYHCRYHPGMKAELHVSE